MGVMITKAIWRWCVKNAGSYEGIGEWFDLSKKAIERFGFSFGKENNRTGGYFISDNCIGCDKGVKVCPQNCDRDRKSVV